MATSAGFSSTQPLSQHGPHCSGTTPELWSALLDDNHKGAWARGNCCLLPDSSSPSLTGAEIIMFTFTILHLHSSDGQQDDSVGAWAARRQTTPTNLINFPWLKYSNYVLFWFFWRVSKYHKVPTSEIWCNHLQVGWDMRENSYRTSNYLAANQIMMWLHRYTGIKLCI